MIILELTEFETQALSELLSLFNFGSVEEAVTLQEIKTAIQDLNLPPSGRVPKVFLTGGFVWQDREGK